MQTSLSFCKEVLWALNNESSILCLWPKTLVVEALRPSTLLPSSSFFLAYSPFFSFLTLFPPSLSSSTFTQPLTLPVPTLLSHSFLHPLIRTLSSLQSTCHTSDALDSGTRCERLLQLQPRKMGDVLTARPFSNVLAGHLVVSVPFHLVLVTRY
jgi:hypothetical protein